MNTISGMDFISYVQAIWPNCYMVWYHPSATLHSLSLVKLCMISKTCVIVDLAPVSIASFHIPWLGGMNICNQKWLPYQLLASFQAHIMQLGSTVCGCHEHYYEWLLYLHFLKVWPLLDVIEQFVCRNDHVFKWSLMLTNVAILYICTCLAGP